MSLDELLMSAKSEEDVKKEWIAFLDIKEYSLGKVDLSTKNCWFEFKYNRKEDNIVNIAYAELFNYVMTAIKDGRELPKFLIVANRFLFVMVETSKILNDLKHNDVDWSFTPSKPTMKAIDFVEQKTSMFFRMFNVKKEEKYIKEYYDNAVKNGEIIKTDITVNNIQDVYKNWYDCIGRYIIDVNKKLKLSEMQLNYIPKDKEYRVISNIIISLFYADIFRTDFSQHDIDNKDTAVITYSNTGIPYFILNNSQYTIGSIKNYNIFQNKYNIPTDASMRKELYARADLLLEDEVKKYIGAFYTPLRLAKKSIEYMSKHYDLDDYVIWDMCAGTGNLEMQLSNKSNVYLSTLNGSDVDTMKRSGYFIKNNVFQYDYLNDDIDAFGNIDYNISNKVPQPLREAIKNKKVLIYINPPYAEATNINEKNKEGVAKTVFSSYIKEYGKASNELFTHFMIRIEKEMPCAILGMYSTLKYVNAPNFVDFRDNYKASYVDGFVFQANKYFDGVKGSFPIGFLLWDLKEGKINDIKVDVFNEDLNVIDKKLFYNDDNYLSKWIRRPKANNIIVPPLKNAYDITDSIRVDKWSDGAIAYMYCNANDLQHTGQRTALFSSAFGSGSGFYVNNENIEKASIIFAVRKMIKHTWLNDRDQLLIPDKELSEEFKDDCFMYTLFNNSNLSASAKLNYNNKDYNIINHFIPFKQDEVNAKEPFTSSFIYDYMKDKSFSKEALDVLKEGQKIWTKFFSIYNDLSIDTMIDKQLSNDAGWYQIRKTLEGLYGKNYDKDFKETYKKLEDKLIPQVYGYGFLR